MSDEREALVKELADLADTLKFGRTCAAIRRAIAALTAQQTCTCGARCEFECKCKPLALSAQPSAGEPVAWVCWSSRFNGYGTPFRERKDADDDARDERIAGAEITTVHPLYAHPAPSNPVADRGEAVAIVRGWLERSKVAGREYIYCLKPSEIEAMLREIASPAAQKGEA